jgi:anti-sigma B factor antagonist
MALIVIPRLTADTVVLDLEGRLWVLDLPLHDRVRDLLANGCRYFIVNLEKVEYIDSSGLGQLVALWTSVRTRGGNLVLMRPGERVRRLLTVTRLNVVFDVYQDEAKAKAAIRREG